MTLEQKYFIALSELENAYIELTKGAKSHQVLRNAVNEYVEYLEKENQKLKQQLQQRDNIINKAKEIIDKFYISNNFVVYDNNDITKAIIELFKILNIDKGE